MARELELRADCSRCAALCCVGLHIDGADSLGATKPAGVPCRHLGADRRCSIHAERAAHGFGACVGYDCRGAGQRVTELFAGRSWRSEPELLVAMLDAFFVVRRLHELLELLELARRLPLSPAQLDEWRALRAALEAGGAGLAQIGRVELDVVGARVQAFLTTLRPCARDARGRRRLPLARPRNLPTPPSTRGALPVVKLKAPQAR